MKSNRLLFLLPLLTLCAMAGFFGWALVFIYYSKSELLTSNMMIVSIGWYYRRSSWARALRLLTLCYVGNALGGLFIAVTLLLPRGIIGTLQHWHERRVEKKIVAVPESAPSAAE
jgi:formate/nitrite transporter FocA (FNT family)